MRGENYVRVTAQTARLFQPTLAGNTNSCRTGTNYRLGVCAWIRSDKAGGAGDLRIARDSFRTPSRLGLLAKPAKRPRALTATTSQLFRRHIASIAPFATNGHQTIYEELQISLWRGLSQTLDLIQFRLPLLYAIRCIITCNRFHSTILKCCGRGVA